MTGEGRQERKRGCGRSQAKRRGGRHILFHGFSALQTFSYLEPKAKPQGLLVLWGVTLVENSCPMFSSESLLQSVNTNRLEPQ